MKTLFNNFSIKTKNITIILVVVFFSIAATIIVQAKQNIESFRKNLETQVESVAKVIGTNSVVAIEFDDKRQGLTILRSLNAIPEVVGAVIYDKNKKEFVTFKKDPDLSFKEVKKLKNSIKFEDDYMYLSADINFSEEYYGTIHVIASTENLSRRIYNYMLFSSTLLLVIFLVSAILGALFSRNLTRPILKLADTAAVISHKGDYSIRVKKFNNDEIGTLYESFNKMLDQISAKSKEIRKLNEGLEDMVLERTRDLVKAKEQAEEARHSAELADKAKSTFLANMSHEIRTPMNAILGYSGLLMKLITDKKRREYLEIVQTSGKNLLALIDDILDLSKIESGKLKLVFGIMNPDRIFDEIQNIFKIKTEEKGIDFFIEVDPDIPNSLLMDEIRLRQILFNVVGNAVKFTDDGYVKLSVRKQESSIDTSRIDLIFEVKDTGIGIPKDQQEGIFKAFEQQKNQSTRYGGTGLGLTITKRLVEIMNGHISLDSRPNKGSTFTIALKGVEISSLENIGLPSALPSCDSIVFDGSKVLLVEDNPYNIQLARTLLEEKEIIVQEALNGIQALEALKTFRPDLILMDMKMPEMDGYETTTIIKSDERYQDIPVIALTADAMKSGQKRIFEIGCDSFLSKPIEADRLFAELMKYLPYRNDRRDLPLTPEKNPAEEFQSLELSEIEDDKIVEITKILTNDMMSRWRDMENSMLLDEWEQFGNYVQELANKYKIRFLAEYGRQIVEKVKHLNIVELKKIIKKFPSVVEVFKKRSEK